MAVYDSVAFRAHQDRRLGRVGKLDKRKPADITTVAQVLAEIEERGYAVVPTRDRDTLRSRGRRQGLRLRFRGHSSAQMKVTLHE